MLACSNQTFMKDFIKAREIGGGFASRILFVVHKGGNERFFTLKEMRTVYKKEADEAKKMKGFLIEDLEIISKMQGEFDIDDETIDTIDVFNASTEEFKTKNPEHLLSGYYNRRTFHAVKISQILSAMESDAMVVRRRHWEKAVQMLLTLEPNMAEAFNYANGNEQATNIELILSTINASGKPMKRRHLIAEFWKRIQIADINICLATLIEMGTIKKTTVDGDAYYDVIR